MPEESERCTGLDVGGRQFDVRVESDDRRVVPLGDLAEEDVGEGVGVQVQFRAAGQVVGEHDGAEHGRDLLHFGAGTGGFSGRDLFGLHEGVGRAEIDGLLGELLDAGAGADALVVHLDVRVDLLERADPLDVQRLREGGARAVQVGGEAGRSWWSGLRSTWSEPAVVVGGRAAVVVAAAAVVVVVVAAAAGGREHADQGQR